MSNQQLIEELYKSIFIKCEKRKVYSLFKDSDWGANLADMQLISKFRKWFRFLLCVFDIYSKYVWFVPLKWEKGIEITNASLNFLGDSNRKPDKFWVDKGSEFYKRSMKSWLQDNIIKMYSAHNERKSVIAERCIRTF